MVNGQLAPSALQPTGDTNRIHVEGVNALGPLELAIMQYMWENGAATVPDIHEHLSANRKKTAYTTVLMTTTRLYQKKLLRQDRSQTAFIYSPAVSMEEYRSGVVNRVLDELCEMDSEAVLKHVIERMAGTPTAHKIIMPQE